MRIVHLSDIHLNKNNFKDFEYFSMPSLIKDLEMFNHENKIDLILIT